jgi:tetratricopeptide (TPR) repeat protein
VERPIPPALRKQLQRWFEYGTQKRKDKDHDYAHAMFAQCVAADPANLVYVEALLGNLLAKYEGKKKKARVRSSRQAFKKAQSDKEWPNVITLGLDLLKENPWDVATLRGMAEACAALRTKDERFNEIELRYLKTALDGNPKDVGVNRHCAESLERMGQFDQAIACWHRIEELAGKGEATERISQLTVRKNLHASGMLDVEHGSGHGTVSRPAGVPQKPISAMPGASPDPADLRKQLERAIAEDPSDAGPYLKLAELHQKEDRLADAEAILRRAQAASGNNLKVRELLESVQIHRGRAQLAAAEQQASHGGEEARALLERMKQELNRLELGIYQGRAERYPANKGLRFELAVRLKRVGRFKEAAELFREVADDSRYAPSATVQRGECLQQLRQYQEALQCYVDARELAGDRDLEVRKLALYRAGTLAMGLKEPDQARSAFAQLHQLDPAYRDVQARLDKLRPAGDT